MSTTTTASRLAFDCLQWSATLLHIRSSLQAEEHGNATFVGTQPAPIVKSILEVGTFAIVGSG
jgi:hypothetical protein